MRNLLIALLVIAPSVALADSSINSHKCVFHFKTIEGYTICITGAPSGGEKTKSDAQEPKQHFKVEG